MVSSPFNYTPLGADVLIVIGAVEDLKSPVSAILDIDRKFSAALRSDKMPIEQIETFGVRRLDAAFESAVEPAHSRVFYTPCRVALNG